MKTVKRILKTCEHLNEISKLRDENKRLRSALRFIIPYWTTSDSSNIFTPSTGFKVKIKEKGCDALLQEMSFFDLAQMFEIIKDNAKV